MTLYLDLLTFVVTYLTFWMQKIKHSQIT